jgi:hypothetical protein
MKNVSAAAIHSRSREPRETIGLRGGRPQQAAAVGSNPLAPAWIEHEEAEFRPAAQVLGQRVFFDAAHALGLPPDSGPPLDLAFAGVKMSREAAPRPFGCRDGPTVTEPCSRCNRRGGFA